MNTVSNLTPALLGIGMPGLPEMLLILGILILLFGAKKLPELAKGMGKSIKEFKKATNENDSEEATDGEKKPAAKRDATKANDVE